MREPRSVHVGAVLVGATGLVTLAVMPLVGDFTLFVLGLVVVQSIAVLSLNLLMGYAGQVSLGQAAFVGVGAFATAEAARVGTPFPLTILAGVVGGALVAAIVGLPSLRIRGFQVAATTLAFGLVAERLLFTRPWDPGAGTGLGLDRPNVIDGGQGFLLLALAGLAAVIAVDRAIRRSRVGRAFTAIRDREDTAAARGIPVGLTKLLAYALSGAIAGLAGGLFAYLLQRATPESFTAFVSLGLVAAVVVGGLGSWSGAIVAGVVFAGLPELLRPAAGYAPLAGAALLLIVPVLRPEGLGWVLDRTMTFGRRERAPAAGSSEDPRAAIEGGLRPLPLAMPVRTVLAATDVAVSFGGVRALAGVTLEVRRREIVGLIGPNGAGKSTFFDAISGAIPPDTGAIRYRGRDLLSLPAAARPGLGIGRTFQQVGLSPRLTVLDNVVLAQHVLARYGVSAALVRAPHVIGTERRLRERAIAALEIVGLRDEVDATVGDLSHGQRRLAEVAAVLASGPDLVLLDEPFAGTGPEESVALADRLADLRDALDITIVVIEHDVPLVARVSDHIYVLDQGVVLAEGSPAEIQADPDVAAIYVGTPVERREVVHA